MSAVPKQVHEAVTAMKASIQPFTASEKIYVQGSSPDIQVPFRKVSQSDTPASFGAEKNPPFYIYDTSGPYTDTAVSIDLRLGLPALRENWIEARGDTERLSGPSSSYGHDCDSRQHWSPGPLCVCK